MKKALLVLLVLVISTIILIGQCSIKNGTTENSALAENPNIRTMEVVEVYINERGKFIDFKNSNIGYFIGTTDGNLWKYMEEVEVGDIVVFDTLGTEQIEDDIIVGIK